MTQKARIPVSVGLLIVGGMLSIRSERVSEQVHAAECSGRATADLEITASVEVSLSLPANLPDLTRSTLLREVDHIWNTSGLRIDWTALGHELSDRHDCELHVLVVRDGLAPLATEANRRAVGSIRWTHGSNPVIVVSVERAQWVVDRGLRWQPRHDAGVNVPLRALGLVLGRAVAHEIGHYVFDTSDHSRSGLMREMIDPREFAGFGPGNFGLDSSRLPWRRPHGQAALVGTTKIGPFPAN